ncbi:hypothetical protein TW80_06890 [Loktanella sp. S4079]|nr:hypothetical protein TW80_06890 [Loktanella sp. S4079]
MGYAAVSATSSGIAMFIMSGVHGGQFQSVYPAGYEIWVALAGAISGALALYLTRGWLGLFGKIGLARAVFGACAMALIAALIAGTLIMPVYGTFFAPILVVAAVGLKPWLGVAWMAVVLMAHAMFVRRATELRIEALTADDSAVGQLSPLSQANLYRRRSHMH